MCSGVFYSYQTKNIITYFTDPTAQLPAIAKNNKVVLLPWGRRKKQLGQLPLGGWIQYDTLNNGQWDEYFPKLVQLPILKFMQADIEEVCQWFDVTAGQFIQGVVMQHNNEQRAYIVVMTPSNRDAIYERWPKLMSAIV